MIRNYLKLAFRHLARKKLFSFINIFGLTIGLTQLYPDHGLFIADELKLLIPSIANVLTSRIARMTMEYSKGASVSQIANTGSKAGPQFKRLFPGVIDFCRTIVTRGTVITANAQFEEKKLLYADSAFFRIFSFPLIKGDPSALYTNGNIILTMSAAKKYFSGAADPIGKEHSPGKETVDYRVAAIVVAGSTPAILRSCNSIL